jgi:hypothetical protein
MAGTSGVSSDYGRFMHRFGLGLFFVLVTAGGAVEQEAVVPLETRTANSLVLWFDNNAPYATGVALANLAAQQASITVVGRDESGNQLGQDAVALAAQGHDSFVMSDRLPFTAQKRGTLEFRTPAGGQIGVLGLRFNGGAFTTIPVMAK